MTDIDTMLARHIAEARRVKLTVVTPDEVNCVVRGDRKLAHDIGLALMDYFKREKHKQNDSKVQEIERGRD